MDPQEIADILGGLLVDKTGSEYPGYSIRVVDLNDRIRLRLELSSAQDEVRLYVERFRNRGPRLMGAITLHDVRSISTYPDRGEVYFMGEHTSLTVTSRAMFSVSSV